MRRAAEVVGQVRIADVPRQHHAANAQGYERKRTLASNAAVRWSTRPTRKSWSSWSSFRGPP